MAAKNRALSRRKVVSRRLTLLEIDSEAPGDGGGGGGGGRGQG